jgi:hypothetical protein
VREKKLTNAVAVRLSPEQLEAIDEMVVALNRDRATGILEVGRTEVIRRAVAEYIETHAPRSKAALVERAKARLEAIDDAAAVARTMKRIGEKATALRGTGLDVTEAAVAAVYSVLGGGPEALRWEDTSYDVTPLQDARGEAPEAEAMGEVPPGGKGSPRGAQKARRR